ncbi:AAA family ATPase [Lichenifustis flavocetrariae]|uniref:AAA family ATPase n=1 Tax=Lichenifustis flavocetrariae TaxID=2949735 RepID=A0AA41Z022_9HYPH|nr:AAA family ATPase [Lichenifustis flavocetrariae]MCW6511729.1 AAA family ATPase [Lichenifustis flavocetrariae]
MTSDTDPHFTFDEEEFDPLEVPDGSALPHGLDDMGLGVDVIDRRALREAIRGLSTQGEGSDDETSREEASRVKLLRGLLQGNALYKQFVVGTPELIERLATLRNATPNFRDAADVVRRAARLSLATATPMRIPPLLLLGPPGIGKTHFAQGLAVALETSVTVIAGSTLADRGVLTGTNTSWRGARPGALAKALLAAPTISPVIVIDEVDKMTGLSAHDTPLDALLTMLEPETARAYRDEYYDVPMRADAVTWIMTANDLASLSEPLRDRLLVLDIPDLTAAQRAEVYSRIFATLNAALGGAFDLAPEALASLGGLNTRRAKAVITQALGIAVDQERRTVTAADMVRATELVLPSGGSHGRGIGFGLMGSVPQRG